MVRLKKQLVREQLIRFLVALLLLSQVITGRPCPAAGAEAAAAKPEVVLETSTDCVAPDDYFEVRIFCNSPDQELYGAGVTLAYDAASVERVDYEVNGSKQEYTRGDGFGSGLAVFRKPDSHTIVYAVADKTAHKGKLELVRLRFKALAAGQTVLTAQDFQIVSQVSGETAFRETLIEGRKELKLTVSNGAGSGRHDGVGSTDSKGSQNNSSGSLQLPGVGAGAPAVEFDLSNFCTASVATVNGVEVTTIAVNEAAALSSLRQAGHFDVAVLPAANTDAVTTRLGCGFLAELAAANASLKLTGRAGSYILPASGIPTADLAAELGAPESAIQIIISIVPAGAEQAALIERYAREHNLVSLVTPVEFKVEAAAAGQTVELKSFGAYATRSLNMPAKVDTTSAVGVVLNPDGTVSPAPTRFMVVNGVTVAYLSKMTNGVYTVVQNPQSFVDLTGHWAAEDVRLLASRMILNGRAQNVFEPNDRVTRAEFTAILVRALGLPNQTYKSGFTDVQPQAWYAGAVAAALEKGLIKGSQDGAFRPDACITREEVAAMVVRALRYAGQDPTVPSGELETYLGRFKDSSQLSAWSRSDIASAVKAGVIKGDQLGRFAPKKYCTRAEAAAMVRLMLTAAYLI